MGNFSMLPSDLVLNILVRLPVESVLECKLVSKPWRTIVQHPLFPKLHLNHLNYLASTVDSCKSSFIFYKHFSYTEYDESLNQFSGTRKMDLRPPFQNYQIIGSCNGLICFTPCYEKEYGALRCEPAYICNPITRECIILPESESDRVDFVTGFGYIPSTNEYKVVRIYNSWSSADSEFIQVYTLGSGVGWRNAGKLDYKVVFATQRGMFANGAIHWVDSRGVFANGAIHWVDSEGHIISFNLADEEVHKLPPPPSLPQIPLFIVILQVLGDFLCAYNSSFMDEDCGIWFLKKNTNNQDVFWSKEFSDFSHFGVTPITITKSGRLLYYNFSDKNVYRYAPEGSSSRKLVDFGENFQHGVLHKNTFVSLKALGEEDVKQMDSAERVRFSVESESSDH